MSEDAIRAARMMQAAAESMQSAASHMSDVLQRHNEAMSWHNDAMDRHCQMMQKFIEDDPSFDERIKIVGEAPSDIIAGLPFKTAPDGKSYTYNHETVFGGKDDPFIKPTLSIAKNAKERVWTNGVIESPSTLPFRGVRPTLEEVCLWSYKEGSCLHTDCPGNVYQTEHHGNGEILRTVKVKCHRSCTMEEIHRKPPPDVHCHAGRDGECNFKNCPQTVEGNYKTFCPLHDPKSDEEY